MRLWALLNIHVIIMDYLFLMSPNGVLPFSIVFPFQFCFDQGIEHLKILLNLH